MTELLSAQGVFDKEQMFFIPTTAIAASPFKSSLLLLGTPSAGLAVRLVMPVQPTTTDNVVTVTLHGSLTEDGAIVAGSMGYEKVLVETLWDTPLKLETLIPFSFPTDTPWAVLILTQSLGPDTLTGWSAGIVLDHKQGDWTREPGWDISKDFPA